MAGLLATGLVQGDTSPEQASSNVSSPNLLVELLAKMLAQTKTPPPSGRSAPTDEPPENAMRKQKGPIRAETAKKATNRRDRILSKIP